MISPTDEQKQGRQRLLKGAESYFWFEGSKALFVPCFANKIPPKRWPQIGVSCPDALKKLFDKHPHAIMLSALTGGPSGMIMVDIDFRHDGQATFDALERELGPLPGPRYTTPGGFRVVLSHPKGCVIRSRSGTGLGQGVDVRGGSDEACRGHAVVPPSVRPDGGKYEWVPGSFGFYDLPEVPLPWLFYLIFSARQRERMKAVNLTGPDSFGSAPPAEWNGIAQTALRTQRVRCERTGEYVPDQRADNVLCYVRKSIRLNLEEAEAAEEGTRNEVCNTVCMCIWSLIKGAEAEGCNVTDLVGDTYVEMAGIAASQDVEEQVFESMWERTEDAANPRDLSEIGYGEDHFADLATNNSTGLARVSGEIIWPKTRKLANGDERTDDGHPENAAHLFACMGVELRFNEFSNTAEVSVGGKAFQPIDDRFVGSALTYAETNGLRAKPANFQRWVDVFALERKHHPVKDYLASLVWDRVPRVDTWLSQYLGAEDTPLHREFGRITLAGAVKRILQPGCKFDTMLVLESPEQGKDKSTALRELGVGWFTDCLKMGADAKVVIEQTTGYWIIEVQELSEMDSREVEAVKAMITTQEDRARPAYGRLAVTVPRQSVLFGTTNNQRYLRDKTGNRRFLPVRVGKIDVKRIIADRDQIWAEAYHRVMDGESQMMKPEFYAAAAVAQQARVVVSEATLEHLTDLVGDIEHGKILKADLYRALGFKGERMPDQKDFNAIGGAMRALGWDGVRKFRNGSGSPKNCFSKLNAAGEADWLVVCGGRLTPETASAPVADGAELFAA